MWPVTRPKDCFVQTSESQDRRRRYLSPVEAAHFLGGLNSRTVVRWAREGYLPSYPLGEGKRRLWRFLEHDLEARMLSHRTGTLNPAADAPTGGYAQ
jgi:glycine/D-amino acid oxidase-like deaminating enzyme